MYRLIFKNRRIALLFVAMMLLSAVRLVGTSEEAGALAQMERDVTHQRDKFERTIGGLNQGELEGADSAETSFAEEQELIDPAGGIEPAAEEPDPDIEREGPQVALTHPLLEN